MPIESVPSRKALHGGEWRRCMGAGGGAAWGRVAALSQEQDLLHRRPSRAAERRAPPWIADPRRGMDPVAGGPSSAEHPEDAAPAGAKEEARWDDSTEKWR